VFRLAVTMRLMAKNRHLVVGSEDITFAAILINMVVVAVWQHL